MCQAVAKLSSDWMNIEHKSQSSFDDYASAIFALGLYVSGDGSLGYCAQLANMSEFEFIDFLAKNNVPSLDIDDDDDLLEDLKNFQACHC